MKSRLATINMQVVDPQRSRRFYEDVLGMVEEPRRSHPPDFIYMKSGSADITLAAHRSTGGEGPSQAIELGFEVDDFEAMRNHVATLGLTDHREEAMGWGRALELRDPDGQRIVVYSLSEENGEGRN